MTSEVHNEDCMLGMAKFPDKFFDLAIVDPQYGIKESSYRKTISKCAATKKKYNTSLWKQKKPDLNYFTELFRVSKNQVIWGGNYFTKNLSESRCWVVWDKETQDSNFADIELAWTSFNESAKLFKFAWNGMIQGNMKDKEVRIHPTQKPITLYKWLLKNYAKEGNKIIDTHLGSQSSRIACWDGGFDFWGWEIDKGYFNEGNKRFENYKVQLKLTFL